MNNTKWGELRLAMYALDTLTPRFRIKDTDCNEPSDWDGGWFYHFRLRPYVVIEWVDILVTSNQQRDEVRSRLHRIHVPGVETQTGFRVFGWVSQSSLAEYI